MTDLAYEKIATRARELLNVKPRPTTQDVADAILAEVGEEFAVPEWLRASFVERLRPAMMTVVGSARAKLIRELEEEAARAYFAKPIPSAEPLAIRGAKPSDDSPAPALGAGMDDQGLCEAHRSPAVVSAPEPGIQPASEAQSVTGAPTPASGGQWTRGPQAPRAAQPEPGRADGDQSRSEAQRCSVAPPAPEPAAIQQSEPIRPTPPAPVTPLSLRMEVLDGWRALRDETMFVPEHGDVTYGSASVPQIDRAITYQHARAKASVDKARRLRILRDVLTDAGAACLDELLDGRALPGRES